MNLIFALFRNIVWPLVLAGLVAFVILTVRDHLLDRNKISAATNKANCQIELQKNKMTEFGLCKDIFDSARR
jgi:hypothetical protein